MKSEGGEAQQLLENRPLWWDDKFSTVVDINITYMLIETSDSHIAASGTLTGTAAASGKIGETPSISVS